MGRYPHDRRSHETSNPKNRQHRSRTENETCDSNAVSHDPRGNTPHRSLFATAREAEGTEPEIADSVSPPSGKRRLGICAGALCGDVVFTLQ